MATKVLFLIVAAIAVLATTAFGDPVEHSQRAPETSTINAELTSEDEAACRPFADSSRQGGENFESAVVIEDLPASLSGTTCGYVNDSSDWCEGVEALGPDVVYAYTASTDTAITVDTCGSEIDTMIFIWGVWPDLLACDNDRLESADEECSVYTSWIERFPVEQGVTYYIVVGGYSSNCGEYMLEVKEYEACELNCVGMPEGEPELHDGYVDLYNSACALGEYFQPLHGDQNGELVLCGRSGWYESPGWDVGRDIDAYVVTLGPSGILEWQLDAAQWTRGAIAYPTDCDNYTIMATFETGACGSNEITYEGQPGDEIWLAISPVQLNAPQFFLGHEFDYVCTLRGLQSVVAVEQRSWSAVKELYSGPRGR